MEGAGTRVAPRWIWVVVGLAVLVTTITAVIRAVVLTQSDDGPISVGADFSRAVCEGTFETATELASPSLRQGMEPGAFGNAMRGRSDCSGHVRDWAGQMDLIQGVATVRVRLDLDGGQDHYTSLRVRETEAGWRVFDFATYRGEWPPPTE